MTENSINRVAAILLTVLMLTSAIIVVMPQSNVAAASETNDITLKVKNAKTADNIIDAVVMYTEVHTGKVFVATYWTNDSAYHVVNSLSTAYIAEPGYYRIDISRNGYYNYKNITGFRFDATMKKTLTTVMLVPFGDAVYTYTVNVVSNTTGNPISGAIAKFYNRTMKQEVASNVTGITGQTNLKIFGSSALDLVVSASTYEMNVTARGVINSSKTLTVSLNDSAIVYGDASKASGGYALNAVSYLYNKNPAIPWEKRVLRSAGSSILFYAYPGNWELIVDGSDTNPYIANLTVSGTTPLTISLDDQIASRENITMFMTSWNGMSIATDAVWRADKTYAGLDFADVGSLRAQVDLALGIGNTIGNGQVDASEWALFRDMILAHGANYVGTSNLFKVKDVNTTQYISSLPATQLNVGNFAWSYVTSMGSVTYNSNVSYTSQVPLSTNATSYSAQFFVVYDSPSMNRSFKLTLPSNYELVNNETTTNKVKITGYQPIVIDPQLSTIAGSGTVNLYFEKSLVPIVKGKVATDGNAYAVNNKTGVLLYYIVKVNSSVTFDASESTDLNNPSLKYLWDFGDSTPTATNVTSKHNYTTGFINRTVTLTVTDVTQRSNTTTFNVTIDSQVPRVKLNAYNLTYAPLLGSTISIDQHKSLLFNPNGTLDDIVNVNDGLGMIDTYQWKFGNDSNTVAASDTKNLTVKHTFDTAGDIKVVLNVTDVVGNWKNATITVAVRDKTPPTVNIVTILNDTYGTSLIERRGIIFNATTTVDNIDKLADLNFQWDFGDKTVKVNGTGAAFANITHIYNSYGKYDLKLNVTDKSGNNATLVKSVYVGAGPRPDVVATVVTFDPKQFEEGQAGKITVNITNDGSAIAKNITIELWTYTGTEALKRIGFINMSANMIRDSNGTIIYSLGVGQSAYGVFNWVPDARGNYTIRAIVNCTDQQQTNTFGTSTVDVKEAGWKSLALYGGLLVIVIVVPLLFFARKRISAAGGLRRPKVERELKEKKKEKESGKEKE